MNGWVNEWIANYQQIPVDLFNWQNSENSNVLDLQWLDGLREVKGKIFKEKSFLKRINGIELMESLKEIKLKDRFNLKLNKW